MRLFGKEVFCMIEFLSFVALWCGNPVTNTIGYTHSDTVQINQCRARMINCVQFKEMIAMGNKIMECALKEKL